MDAPTSKPDVSAISSAAISSSTSTTKETSSSLVSTSPTTLTSSGVASSSNSSVPATVITSVKSAILPFPFKHDANPTPVVTQHHTENPNLVSLLRSNNDSPPTASAKEPLQSVNNNGNTSLQSILLSKDAPQSESESRSNSGAASLSPIRTSTATPVNDVPTNTSQSLSQHHMALAETCHQFFLSTGIHPSSAFMPACATQTNALSNNNKSNSTNCMIYKGYKKLCNAKSLFKCQSSCAPSSANNNGQANVESVNPLLFNPNHPFGTAIEGTSPVTLATSSTSASSASSCILSDLLRGGCNKSRNKKNLPFTQTLADNNNNNASLMDTMTAPNEANRQPNDRLISQHNGGALALASLITASINKELLDQQNSSPVESANERGHMNHESYMSQFRRHIKKLYQDSDKGSGGDSKQHLQSDNVNHSLPRTTSVAEAVPSNSTRKSVISKMGAYPQNQIQQARDLCSRMAEFGYKLPYCTPSTSSAQSSQPPLHPYQQHAATAQLSHQSVNSYLDSLIRSNVIREQAPLTTLIETVPSAPQIPTTTITPLSSDVITTAADINPNKPHHFVNLIDKIISNVFTITTASGSVTSNCFLSPNASLTTTQAISSLSSVLSAPEPVPSASPALSSQEAQAASSTPSYFAPPATPPRPPSNVSAITQLLNSDGSPPASPHSEAPSPCHNTLERPSPKPSPKPTKHSSQPMECLSDISDKVYQQLIEFEFNHESILKKFQTSPNSDSISHSSSSRPGLNPNEKARIEELEKVLYPLQFCLSSMCEQRAALKKNLHKSFFQKNSNVSVDFQRQTLLATTESAINLLIELTKQLESFAELSSSDQMNLLRTSVMEIMLMRSILIMPQRLKEKISSLKRCLDENAGEGNSSTGNNNSSSTVEQGKLFAFYMAKLNKEEYEGIDEEINLEEPLPGKDQMEPCTSHPHDRPFAEFGGALDTRRLEELMTTDEIGSESSRDSFTEDVLGGSVGSGDNMAADYAKQFRAHYVKLARSIDKDWYEDRTIFYLLFAILLFRPTKSNIVGTEKVREEHLTYVYLLKRYLENKFKSYCTARSHFIRIFDRLEELQKMNDQVIQKLLDFDLVCAQNLLEKLCIC